MWKKHMWTSGFYRYEHIIFLQKAGVSKHSSNKFMQLLWTVVTYLPKKMLNMELNMMFWIVLMEFAYIKTFLKFTVDLLNTLQYKQDDKFDSLLVCNIMFRGSQQILFNKFCALALSNPTSSPNPPCL